MKPTMIRIIVMTLVVFSNELVKAQVIKSLTIDSLYSTVINTSNGKNKANISFYISKDILDSISVVKVAFGTLGKVQASFYKSDTNYFLSIPNVPTFPIIKIGNRYKISFSKNLNFNPSSFNMVFYDRKFLNSSRTFNYNY